MTSTTVNGHNLVRVDPDEHPDASGVRCVGCGQVASWNGASTWDRECFAARLPLFDEGAA